MSLNLRLKKDVASRAGFAILIPDAELRPAPTLVPGEAQMQQPDGKDSKHEDR